MNTQILAVLVIIGTLTTVNGVFYDIDQNFKRQELNQAWKFRKVNETPEKWFSTQLPSTVQTELLKNNQIKDFTLRDYEPSLGQLEQSDWIYHTTFSLENDQVLKSQEVDLVFEGIDTHADVYLNGEKILEAHNQHRYWTVKNMKSKLKQSGNNLTVYIHSSVSYDNQQASKYNTEQKVRLPSTWGFSRKAAYHYGWDWGPRIVTAGIWRPVYVQYYNYSQIVSTFFQTAKLNYDSEGKTYQRNPASAEMKLRIDLEVFEPGQYRFVVTNQRDSQVIEKNFTLEKSAKSTVNIDFSVASPKLWWCQGLGEPELYPFSIRLYFVNQSRESLVQEYQTRTGIRQATWRRDEDPKTHGKELTLLLNGFPVFVKGANWIPPKSNLPEAWHDQEVYFKSFQAAKDAKYNMLRFWGGGQFEYQVFYDLCDENGIMIWHDFMFACNMYPADEFYLSNIEAEIRDNVRNLRNHPSIVIWNGNNEVEEGWTRWGWQSSGPEGNSKVWQWYLQIFNKTIPKVLSEEHPDIFYWPTSPSSQPWDNTIHSGDVHYWGVWHAGNPIEDYARYIPRFSSEYGIQAFPLMSSIVRFTEPEDRSLQSNTIRVHEKGDPGFGRLFRYVNDATGVTSSDKFEKFVYASNLMQQYALEIAIRALRSSKPYNMGSMYWQMNDVWPVISWSTVDSYGEYKAAHHSMKYLHDNILAAVSITKDSQQKYPVHLINDDRFPTEGKLTVLITQMDGKVIHKEQIECSLAEGENKIVWHIEPNHVATLNNVVIELSFVQKRDSKVYKFINYLTQPGKLQLINPVLTHKIEKNTIKIQTVNFAKGVYLHYNDYSKSIRFSDNFFDMMPGSSVTITAVDGDLSEDWVKNLQISSFFSFK